MDLSHKYNDTIFNTVRKGGYGDGAFQASFVKGLAERTGEFQLSDGGWKPPLQRNLFGELKYVNLEFCRGTEGTQNSLSKTGLSFCYATDKFVES